MRATPTSDGLSPDSHQFTYFTVLGTEGERFLVGIEIYGTNDGVVAVDDAVAVGEGASSGNLWAALIGNDTDIDSSPIARSILSVDTSGTQGAVAFDSATKTLTYSAAGIDVAAGETITDTFTYTVTDGVSGSDTATVTVTVTGASGGAGAAAPTAAFVDESFGEFVGIAALSMAQPEILAGDMPIA